MTNNPGVLLINLGQAKLQKSTHTTVHYYNLEPIFQEFDDLDKQFNTLRSVISNKTEIKTEFENYDKIVQHLNRTIFDKLNNIKFTFFSTRSKRSLFPEIGALMKTVTGNLDETDKDRYDEIIASLKSNVNNVQKQLELQYTLNLEAIKRFDSTITNVEHNEKLLEKQITDLSKYIGRLAEAVLIIEPVYNQLIILYNNLNSIIQDIENSLTFCRAGIFHPSILRFEELRSELNRLKKLHQGQIPVEVGNLADLQKLVEVSCRVENRTIVYFLSFPINLETPFNLYILLSIPTLSDIGYSTIIPESKYLLKSNDIVKPLNKICQLGNPYQCFLKDVKEIPNPCELQILQLQQMSSCEHVLLEISGNHIDYVPEINQYLVVFSTTDFLRIELEGGIEVVELKGIFLIESNKGNIVFRNRSYNFMHESKGKPSILPSYRSNSDISTLSDFEIKVQHLNIAEIGSNRMIPSNRVIKSLEESQKSWQVVNCIFAIAILLLLVFSSYRNNIWNLLKNFRKAEKRVPDPIQLTPKQSSGLYPNLSLPGDAKI